MLKKLIWCIAGLIAAPLLLAATAPEQIYATRIAQVLKHTPLIDGHNDLPWEIRDRFHGKLSSVHLRADTSLLPFPPDGVALMTDITRLRRGGVGGQFWSVFVPVEMQGASAVQATLEQIDLVR